MLQYDSVKAITSEALTDTKFYYQWAEKII